MPKIHHVLETCIYGPDLHAMEQFYTAVLGLEKMSAEYPRHVFFRVSADSVLLVFNPQETRKQPPADRPFPPSHGPTGPGHVAFAMDHDDIEVWREALGAHGVAIEQELTWPNGARSLYFRDPAGNSVELVTSEIWDRQRTSRRLETADRAVTEQNVRAPELESPLGWLNTDRPLRLGRELKGQVVLLDFWTYCCINCMHVFPDLKHVEHKYRREPLVVIGVHSAKFTNESTRRTIRAAVHRYEIQHPVIVDDQMNLWQRYGVRSWPTFVVIDPEGYVAATLAGEGNRDALDATVARLLEHHRGKGTLAAGPLTLQPDATVEPATGLAFPGKVLADRDGGRVFISDSNHNRIVVATWPDDHGRCRLLKSIGSGAIGAADGPAEAATFDHPQGLALDGDTLYVADTENHTIRAVDLNDWTVRTVLGTGTMGYDRAGGGKGVQQAISSPWDLAMEGGTLYIAMAGLHQIWRVEMPQAFARALAGSGRENLVDGPVETAAFSQPSGICLHRGMLYVADSEVSAVRGIDLAAERVFTVIGRGLFVFGDEDGLHPAAKLQHCMGVTSWHDKLLVADTYNHKIKLVDPTARSATTLYGTGRPACRDAAGPGFFEPGGLHASGDTLFVADTNNHRVVMIDLISHAWTELKIDGLTGVRAPARPAAPAIEAPQQVVAPGVGTDLALRVELPAGTHVNAEAPWTVRVAADGRVLVQETRHGGGFPIRVTVPPVPGKTKNEWEVTLSLTCCTEDGGARCLPVEVSWRVPVAIGGPTTTHPRTIELNATIDPPPMSYASG